MGLDQLKEKKPDLLVYKNTKPRECSNCKKKYTPTENDISSCYWHQCPRCRERVSVSTKNSLERKKQEKKDEKDSVNIQFSLPTYF